MLGKLLGGRYKVVKVLGSGGFGHTYVAEDTQRPGNPWCVLKHLSFSSSNPTVLQQVRRLFRMEAETLERLGRHDQIPQLLAYFEEEQEFYLVQEFIEGHPLSDELSGGKRFTPAQVVDLLEDVLKTLEFVHAQQVIHRDIKPENLMRRYRDGRLVLIDFGAVKNISNTVAEIQNDTSLSLPIYTSGYGASEQCMGKPQFCSDLYALGMIAIQSLTGLRPAQLPQNPNTLEIIWRDQVQVREDLAAILDNLVKYHPSQRFQSAAEVLQALHQLTHDAVPTRPPATRISTSIDSTSALTDRNTPSTDPRNRQHGWKRWQWGLGVGVLLIAATSFTFARHLPTTVFNSTLSPSQSAVRDRISSGERILTPGVPNSAKREGVDHLAAGDYATAIAALEKARNLDLRDPETLIYLNNARIQNGRAYTIAVAVPLGNTTATAQELLRGVAQVQNAINQSGGIQGVPLKVTIANDDNQPEVAQQIAKELATKADVLGVVGHAASDASLAAGKVYQTNQLVMISPLSSAVQLSDLGDFIFRTVPSDSFTARALCNYMLNRLKKRKVAIFFNPNSAYSASLSEEFKTALFYNQGEKPVEAFDLSSPAFNAYESVAEASRKGAEVLMLAPDSSTSDKALQVLLVNQKKLQVLAGDSIYTDKLLQVWGNAATGMVLAVPSGIFEGNQSAFQQQAKQLWGQLANWRTISAYDATQALVTALKSGDISRKGVQRSLSANDFSAPGVVEIVSFRDTGDRESAVQLVTIAPKREGKVQTGFKFEPLP
jgi:eukaryotic-like serine/threonine-protein kinase